MLRNILKNRLNLNQFVRNYVRKGSVANPGIDRRLRAFADTTIHKNPQLIEEAESDFQNVQEIHKQFEQEERDYQSNVRLWITKNKYFKTKNLNFLTWSEKEQIRLLHEKDPQEWDPKNLSASFPADPETIVKIIKAKWQPKDDKRIKKHDLSVKKAWEQFRSNQLPDLDPQVQEHLKKFSHRDFDDTCAPKIDRKRVYEYQKPKTSEFSSIITSCRKYQEKEPLPQIESSDKLKMPDISRDPERDSFLMEGGGHFTKQSMTFKEFQKTSNIKPDENEENTIELNSSIVDFKKLNKTQTQEVTEFGTGDQAIYRSLEIKDHIKIPKSVWKKGKIYKVDDCFYDFDGEFLYRVPGLK